MEAPTTILGWEIVALGVVRSPDSTLALTAPVSL